MKKTKILILLTFCFGLFMFNYSTLETKAAEKIPTYEFLPLGVNFIDPDNAVYLPINDTEEGIIKNIKPIRIEGGKQYCFSRGAYQAIYIDSLTVTEYTSNKTMIGTVTIQNHNNESKKFQVSSNAYYINFEAHVSTDDRYDISRIQEYYIIDLSKGNNNFNKESDYQYAGPNLGNLELLQDSYEITTDASDPITIEEIRASIFVYDFNDGNITNRIEVDKDSYSSNSYAVGDWEIKYSVVNSVGMTRSLTITVHVIDDIGPVFQGPKTINVNNTDRVNINTIKSKFTAHDAVSGDATSTIKVIEDKFTPANNKCGTYKVKLEASDKLGNVSYFETSVTIVQNDHDAPKITGVLTYNLLTTDLKDDAFFLSGLQANDDFVGNVTNTLTIKKNEYKYNKTKLGEYIITVSAHDGFGNYSTKDIEVTVVDKSSPVFIVNPINIKMPLQVNMKNTETIIDYLKKTNYLTDDEVIILNNEYEDSNNQKGHYLLSLKQMDKEYNVVIELIENDVYNKKIIRNTDESKTPTYITKLKEVINNVTSRIKGFFKNFFQRFF